MVNDIHLLGDGLAGTWLARQLALAGAKCQQYGDGNTNTPPVAFVHLFQGRTFHRDPVEVEAFKKAIEFWRNEPLAKEWEVHRTVKPGDRLHRSAETESVPPEFRPIKVTETQFRYSPGFTVAAQELVARWRGHCPVINQWLEPSELQARTIIHATGLSIESSFPDWRWDTNPGRTVNAEVQGEVEFEPQAIFLHKGCHIGGNPDGKGLTLGGRVSSKGEAKDDETLIASALLGKDVKGDEDWWGKRIANALDRWPMIGWFDESNFLFCGFGGRALFWLPYCAELAVTSLLSRSNEGIPKRLLSTRFQQN